jgi:translocator protein
MMWVFMGLALIFGLVSFVCGIIVLIHAFKESVGQGLLCLFCGPYALYYGFAKFQHEKKGMILAGWLGAAVLAGVLNGLAGAFAPTPEVPQFDSTQMGEF